MDSINNIVSACEAAQAQAHVDTTSKEVCAKESISFGISKVAA